MHRGLTVSVPLLRMWVHCPRASNGLLPRRSNLVGYVRWDAQSDQFPPCQTIIPTAFRSQSETPVNPALEAPGYCRVSLLDTDLPGAPGEPPRRLSPRGG